MNFWALFVLISICFAHIAISIYVFTNGFLIRRLSLNDTNSNAYPDLKRFDKAIVIFVDALRFDFIFTNGQHYGLPTLESKLLNEPYNAKLYKFIADPPTTTMQRIKALMSGSLPTFIDAGSNFNSYVIEDDNLIKQLHLNNKSVVILGDDTWLSLFEHEFIREHHTYPSFNIKDLDTNDQNVNEQLRRILDEKRQTSFKWNFIVAHYLGLDHCGHSFGPKSPVIKRKLRDIDDSIRFVLEKLDDDTLLVVIGDHGMTETGDHGGDSRLELETALFFYSKKKMFIPELNLNEKVQLMRFESIRQINLTPNLALLLGVPIPFSSLGIVLMDIFQNKQLEAIEANYKQMKKFIKKYEQLTNEQFISEQQSDELTSESFRKGNETLRLEKYIEHLQVIQEKCREKWSTFNLKDCLIGLTLTCLSLIFFATLLSVSTDKKYLKESFAVDQVRHLTRLALLSFSLYLTLYVLFQFSFLQSIWIFSFLFNLFYFYNRFKNFNFSQICSKMRFCSMELHSTLILLLGCLIPFSNSFIVSENNSLRFLCVSVLFTNFFLLLRREKIVRLRKLIFFSSILLLLRLSRIFQVCREESIVNLNCTQTVFSIPLNKLVFEVNQTFEIQYLLTNESIRNHFLFLLVNFIIITLIVRFFAKSANRSLKLIIHFKLIILFAYILFQFLIVLSESANSNRLPSELKQVNLHLARLFYILFFVSQFLIFSIQENYTCVLKLEFLSFGLLITLISDTLLSVWFLFLIVHFYAALFCCQSSNLEQKKQNFSSVNNDHLVFLFLLQHYFFYASGHETTFNHIKWDAGFHGFYGDNNNALIRLFMGSLILLNTFQAYLMVSLGCALLLASNFTSNRFKHTKNLAVHFFNALLIFFLLVSFKVFTSAFSVFVLRRHLMVWKIFAPRFVFEIVGLSCVMFFIIFNFILFYSNS